MKTFDVLSIKPEDSRYIIKEFLGSIEKQSFDIIFPGFYELTDIQSWSINSVSDLIEDIIFYTSQSFCKNSKNLLNLYIHFKLGEELKTASISKHAVEKNEIKSVVLSSYDRNAEQYKITSDESGHVNVQVSTLIIKELNDLQASIVIKKYNNVRNTIWSIKELYETVENLIEDKDRISTLIKAIASKLNIIATNEGLILSYLIHYMFLEERNLSYIFSDVYQGRGLGGLFVCYKNKKNIDSNYIENIANNLAIRLTSNSLLKLLHKQTLKTALISILVDSYAHNISAHSLSALKWWFELRHKIADKRFFIQGKGLHLASFQPTSLDITRAMLQGTTEKYYAALGLTDSVYNSQYCSLFDILNFRLIPEEVNKFLIFDKSNQRYAPTVTDNYPDNKGKVSAEKIERGIGPNSRIEINCFNPQFPVSLDYALYPFFRFLRDKGAFWSGVTRDNAYGGESKTWYQVLWEDFANNPLYLGTIAKSEGVSKININLAVKHKNNWTHGRFLTIDLSLMDYEERIANNPNLKIEYQKQDFDVIASSINNNDEGISLDIVRNQERSEIDATILRKLDNKLESTLLGVENNEIEQCHNANEANYIKPYRYSKYAFIRLGERFSEFREILSSAEYTIFLPGGVVGEHAIFTIFENTLRNIKHYKNLDCLSTVGIDFWISIEPEKLNISGVSSDTNKPNELFKVSVWLGHKTKLVEDDHENGKMNIVYSKLSNTTDSPIMDKYGMPIMGGNSQDKACAAMIFNNKFSSVEDKQVGNRGNRNQDYYPWVHFTTNVTDQPYMSDKDLPPSKIKCRTSKLDHINEKSRYEKTLEQNSYGYLKKHFYIWKNDDYIFINPASDLSGENISRFKFVIISSKILDNKIILKVIQEGVIRILIDKDDLLRTKLEIEIPKRYNDAGNKHARIRDERLRLLYSVWLEKWILNLNINIYTANDITRYSSVIIENKAPYVKYTITMSGKKMDGINIPFSHGGIDELSSCNVRSHGVFWEKYFRNVVQKQFKNLLEGNVQNAINEGLNLHLLMDFAEVVATNVFIFDNRIKNRMPINDDKLNVFRKSLKLVVEEERAFDKKKGESFKNHFDQLMKEYESPNVLVMHLSYIESLGYKEMNKNSMNNFIHNELKDLIKNDNFILIITSGRGRDLWKEGLEKKYLQKTIFKPIESFIHAIESGISYNDNFDVKHNIIKVIFGS